ncbi:MAG TPA: hypothetical protein VFY51_04890 [Pyrinomonadaceae bacterium]|nr:hypothetical protein [Pyrinomonadaceae bacterium]
MTRNQKIALGCGGAGCLGLIVVGVAGLLIFWFGWRSMGDIDRYANYNSNVNRNLNLNSNDNENDNSSSNSSDSSSSSDDYTEDEKHKLFQAAAITADLELQRRVWVKIGIVESDFTPGPKYAEFIDSHGDWGVNNYQWVASMNTPEKGRAYVNENLR